MSKKIIIGGIGAIVATVLYFSLQHNATFVSYLAKNYNRGLCYAADNLKANEGFVRTILESNGLALQCTLEHTKQDAVAVKIATTTNPQSLKYASEAFKSDKMFLLELIKKHPEDVSFLLYADESVFKDKDFIFETTNYTDYVLPFTDESIKKDVALTLVKDTWKFLDVFEEDIRNDEDILLEILKDDENISSISFYANPSIISQMQPYNQTLKKLEDHAKRRFRNAISAIQKALYANDFTLRAIENNANVGTLISEYSETRRDKHFALQAVERNGLFLAYLDERLKGDKTIVLAALKENPLAWKFMTSSMRNDREVMFLVIQHDGAALLYASEALKKDKELVLEAVKQDGNLLAYADYSLMNNKDFVLEAMALNNNAYYHVGPDVQMSKEVYIEFEKNKAK